MDSKNPVFTGKLTLAQPMVPEIVFHGKEGGPDALRLTQEGFIYKGELIKDAGEAHRMLVETMSGQKAQSNALEALRIIRQAGHNFSHWATWAQRTAAWGMEPMKWPKQSEDAPPSEPNLRSLHDSGCQAVTMVVSYLAERTVLDHATAFRVAPELVKIVLDEIKKGEM